MTPVWTTSRAAGLAALMTASLAISCGLLMALRIPALRRRAPELRAAHQALANATFALIGVHAVSLLLDPVLRPGLAGLLVPFAAPYRPVATALGQIAAYGMLALGATFYVRRRVGTQRWRTAHRWLPVFWLLAVGHGLLVGTDATTTWALIALAPPVAAAAALLTTRLLAEEATAAAAVIAAGAPARSPGDARHGRRLVPPRPAGPRSARARPRLSRARAHRAALRLRPRPAGRALPLARRARPGCSGCLEALDGELRARGGRLVVRHGRPRDRGAPRRGARPAHAPCTSPTTSRASRGARDARVEQALGRDGVRLIRHPGLYVADLPAIRTTAGRPLHGLLAVPARVEGPGAPARRARAARDRDAAHRRGPAAVAARAGLRRARPGARRAPRARRGRRAARGALAGSRGAGLARYAERRNELAEPTSRLSAYLRFGCLSPLKLERAVAARRRRALPRPARLARLLRRRAAALPRTPRASSSRSATAPWSGTPTTSCVAAWREGRTGFPVVDAAMRQLAATGWMHNRARMIVGSFLTKDLQQDWREGERHFMAHLLDGDVRQQQRRLAVDRLDRHRSGALLPAPVQPDDPAAPLRRRRALRAPLVPRAAPRARRPARRAVDDDRRRAGGRGLSHRARLPRAGGRPRRRGGGRSSAIAPRRPSCRRDGAASRLRQGRPSGSAASAASRSASLNSGSSSVPAR